MSVYKANRPMGLGSEFDVGQRVIVVDASSPYNNRSGKVVAHMGIDPLVKFKTKLGTSVVRFADCQLRLNDRDRQPPGRVERLAARLLNAGFDALERVARWAGLVRWP